LERLLNVLFRILHQTSVQESAMLKKGIFIATALMLVFASNALAGPNATAVVGLDIDATPDNTNDGVISGTATGTDPIVVELFTAPLAGPIVGANIVFNIDQAVVQVSSFANASNVSGTMFALGATGNEVSLGALPSATLTDGAWGAVTFTPQVDVTGVEFEIGVTSFLIVDAGSQAQDTLTTTTKLSFNSQPKVEASAGTVVIPRGGQATATVTPSGFPAGATITFDVQVSGAATVQQAVSNGVLTLTASGSGAATVTVTASDGTTTTQAISITFDEQVPVELASFVGEVVEDNVVLNWATASQTNNAGFRVLRSTDQGTFEVVSDLIDGAGTTDALMNYSFTDETLPAAEQVFYVLEQIDLDGTVHRSNPIEVLLGARFLNLPTEFATAVYPNPFNPSTTVSYDLPAEAQVSIVIYDAIGQEIRQLVNDAHSIGRYSVQWDARDNFGRSVGSGVYIAKIKAGQFSATQKMLLLK
jgi:VCBS repeat-containing protein